jgi:hypothetical protein
MFEAVIEKAAAATVFGAALAVLFVACHAIFSI